MVSGPAGGRLDPISFGQTRPGAWGLEPLMDSGQVPRIQIQLYHSYSSKGIQILEKIYNNNTIASRHLGLNLVHHHCSGAPQANANQPEERSQTKTQRLNIGKYLPDRGIHSLGLNITQLLECIPDHLLVRLDVNNEHQGIVEFHVLNCRLRF